MSVKKYNKTSFSMQFILLFLFFVFFLSYTNVSAVVLEVGIPGDSTMTAGADVDLTPSEYINLIYKFLISFVAIAGFASLVWYGVLWIYSGVAEKKSEAIEGIKNTMIGISLAFGSWVILNTINSDLVSLRDPTLVKTGISEVSGDNNFRDMRFLEEKKDGMFYYDYTKKTKNMIDESVFTTMYTSSGFLTMEKCEQKRAAEDGADEIESNGDKSLRNTFSPCKKFGTAELPVSNSWFVEYSMLNSETGTYPIETCLGMREGFILSGRSVSGCIESETNPGESYFKYGSKLKKYFNSSKDCEEGRVLLDERGIFDYISSCNKVN